MTRIHASTYAMHQVILGIFFFFGLGFLRQVDDTDICQSSKLHILQRGTNANRTVLTKLVGFDACVCIFHCTPSGLVKEVILDKIFVKHSEYK
jgi:hypothetical protein